MTHWVPDFFIADFESYLSQDCLFAFWQNFIHSKKSYEFLKLVKKSYNFGHIFQSLKFFKFLFVPSKGHMDDTKLLLKWFLSSTKYMVTRVVFQFFTIFLTLNLKNSFLCNAQRKCQIFFGHQVLVHIASKWAINQKILATPVCAILWLGASWTVNWTSQKCNHNTKSTKYTWNYQVGIANQENV